MTHIVISNYLSINYLQFTIYYLLFTIHYSLYTMSLSKKVIIAAGGSGNRMDSDVPKQFLLLNGKPVLMHTIERFFIYDKNIEIVVVLPEFQIDYWEKLKQKHNFTISHIIAKGGNTRFQSVKNGLEMINTDGLTAVHDAVRPFVSIETINNCFKTAAEKDSAIPVVELVESLRFISGDGNISCNRQSYRLVQTPQVFNTLLLKKAYQQPYSDHFTDDASVMEKFGIKISLVNGNVENIKITTPLDLILGEKILEYVEQQGKI